MAHITFTTLQRLIHLLSSASLHEGTYVRVLGPSRLGLGSDPLRPSHTLDLAAEELVQHLDDDVPMDLDPSLNTEGTAANGASSSHSVANQNHPQQRDDRHKEIDPPAQKSNTKLMERLDAAASAKRA